MNRLHNLNDKFFLLLLLLVAGVAGAQTHEFAPVGAEWYYERLYREGWNYSGIAYDRFRSLETVEINGWECKEIEFFQNLDCDGLISPYTEIRYITQEGNQIYEVEDGQRLLLYDFDKNPGESWFAPKYDVEVYVIDTTTMILEDGSIRKVLHTFTIDDYFYINNIIEGIGLDRSVFPFYDLEGPPPCKHSQIRCYSEDGSSLIVSDTECDYEILSVDEYEKEKTVHINTLVVNALQIDFRQPLEGTKTAKVIDMAGRVICTFETKDNSLNISFADKPKGMYVVQIVMGAQVMNYKIVKR